jgi:hypothetical protein
MVILKLLQSLVKALHTEGTPGQVAAGLAFGTILGGRWAVRRYRETIGERVRNSGLYRAVTASRLYGIYRLFRPES